VRGADAAVGAGPHRDGRGEPAAVEGEELDLSQRVPSHLVLAAAAVDPAVNRAIGPHLSMTGLPSSLDEFEPLARAVYETGRRPPYAEGPSRAELAEVVALAVRGGLTPVPSTTRRRP